MADILHLSDLHFGPNFQSDRAAGARGLAARLDPDLVVVSGDLTRRARRHEFEAAAAYLNDFQAPVVVTPGNHDVPLYRIWERLFRPYGHYRTYISEELESVTRRPGVTAVALNSTRRFTLTNGRIRSWQLEFAERAFSDSADGDLRVIVTHHHLAPPPDFDRADVMPGARRAIRAFTRMGVDLILAGHMHRAYIGDSLDFLPGGDRDRGIVIVQCGTTTSARGRGRERLKNSLNHVSAEDGQLRITHYLWRQVAADFWPHSEHRFGRGTSRWLERDADGGRARPSE